MTAILGNLRALLIVAGVIGGFGLVAAATHRVVYGVWLGGDGPSNRRRAGLAAGCVVIVWIGVVVVLWPGISRTGDPAYVPWLIALSFASVAALFGCTADFGTGQYQGPLPDRGGQFERRRWAPWFWVCAIGLAIVRSLMKKPEHPLWQPVIATAFCIAAVTSIVEAYRTGTAYGRFSSSDRFRDPTGFNTAILWHGMIALISGIVALASGYELISSWWSH